MRQHKSALLLSVLNQWTVLRQAAVEAWHLADNATIACKLDVQSARSTCALVLSCIGLLDMNYGDRWLGYLSPEALQQQHG